MHNQAYYQPPMLCIGLHLSGTDSCSSSLYKMEELFSAQYFLSFLVVTWQFWIKSSDKHLNFSSESIFCGPWIIWEFFHNFSILATILSMLDTCIIFIFNIQNYFFTLFHVCLFGHWLEHVLWKEKTWPVYNKNSWCTGTSSKRAETGGPPSILDVPSNMGSVCLISLLHQRF